MDSWGHCEEEIKMVRETKKILNLPKLNVMATTTRVPVFNCHCEAITVKLSNDCKIRITLISKMYDDVSFIKVPMFSGTDSAIDVSC